MEKLQFDIFRIKRDGKQVQTLWILTVLAGFTLILPGKNHEIKFLENENTVSSHFNVGSWVVSIN